MNAIQERVVVGTESDAVKISLLDEFSSTQGSKKKKQVIVKVEKIKMNLGMNESILIIVMDLQETSKCFGLFKTSYFLSY